MCCLPTRLAAPLLPARPQWSRHRRSSGGSLPASQTAPSHGSSTSSAIAAASPSCPTFRCEGGGLGQALRTACMPTQQPVGRPLQGLHALCRPGLHGSPAILISITALQFWHGYARVPMHIAALLPCRCMPLISTPPGTLSLCCGRRSRASGKPSCDLAQSRLTRNAPEPCSAIWWPFVADSPYAPYYSPARLPCHLS